MDNKFKEIILDDENIIKEYKPKKGIFILNAVLISIPFIFFMLIPFIPLGIISNRGNDLTMPFNPTVSLVGFAVFFVIFLLILVVFVLVFSIISYKNRFYLVTNKRLIIRSGVFGIDYKTLDLNVITNFNVNVSIVDKILRKNTGAIYFSANSVPSVKGKSGFCFWGIVNPYEVYKEIKEIIDKKY